MHLSGRLDGGAAAAYHRARVEPLDALHDLSLALLPAVLLPVDPGVSQLLHNLRGHRRRCCEMQSLTANHYSHTPIINIRYKSIVLFWTGMGIFRRQTDTIPGIHLPCVCPYLVQLCVDLVDSPLGHLHLLSQLLLHALLLVQRLSGRNNEKHVSTLKIFSFDFIFL